MSNFKLTPQMKAYLRQQIVMTGFELRQHLKREKRRLFQRSPGAGALVRL